MTPTEKVLAEVAFERTAQDAEWGVQSHENSGGPNSRAEAKRKARDWKDENRCRVDDGNLTWDGVLLEEAYEALAEEDPAKLRAELIQVAAVAVCWIEAIDRAAAESAIPSALEAS